MITEECQHCRGIGGWTSQMNPARIIDRCGTCGGTGEIEVPDERNLTNRVSGLGKVPWGR